MKVGILSDTHIHKGYNLPNLVWEELAEVDYILHAGDIVTERLLDDLKLIAPVIAVRGNGDWMIEDLPAKAVFQLEHLKIGMTHGYEGKGKNTQEKAFNTFRQDGVDLIIFGHSHMPYKEYWDGIMLFNPGSPTQRRSADFYSIGILTIEKNTFGVQHIFF